MRLWKKSQGVSPSSCFSHSVQSNNSGSDNGTKFVGNNIVDWKTQVSGMEGSTSGEVNILSLTAHNISLVSSSMLLST